MGEFFRSAINYLSQAGSSGSSASRSHPLVGTTLKMSGVPYRVRSLLAEGGYALVFAVQDAYDNWFALKRQLAFDKSAAETIIKEINFTKELSGHPCIVRYSQAVHQEMKDSSGRLEFLLLMELCTGGTLIDLLQKDALMPEQICKIFYAACSAVQHMHDRSPPITHRDIKIENLLFDSKGYIRLCDFGSATTEIFRPDENWSVSKRNLLEEDMAKYTTPMYRAPEILDTYQNYPIGPAQDVWALGCILYYLCYRQHPFEDSAKLRIINANFTLPDADNTPYSMFHSIIRNSLQPSPYSRPAVGDLCDQVRELAHIMQINLDDPIVAAANGVDSTSTGQDNNAVNHLSQQQGYADQSSGSEMFAQLKGQGLSIFKNIKDKSSAVMQNVQMGTSSLISGYSQSSSETPSAIPRSPPPVPSPPQRHARGGKASRAVPPVPPPPDFFREHPQQLLPSRSSAMRVLPSPPHCRRDSPPRHEEITHIRQRSGPTPPPVPPHQSNHQERDKKQYFEQTHEDAHAQSRWDVGIDRQISEPPTPPLNYNDSSSNVAEADFLGLGETSKPCEWRDEEPKQNGESKVIFDPFNIMSGQTRSTSTCPTSTDAYDHLFDDTNRKHSDNNNSDDFVVFENDDAKNVKKTSNASSAHSEMADLLGLGGGASSMSCDSSVPNFGKTDGNTDVTGLEDPFLLLDTTDKISTNDIAKDVTEKKKEFDPFSDFLANMVDKGADEKSQTSKSQRLNYNSAYFNESRTASGVPKVLPSASAFDDILSAQGFSSTSKQTNRTLADLQREKNIKDMDPIAIKIRDWTAGKERNIRALLSSLSDVLWDDVENRWNQPSMAELLSHMQIKKQYRKACLMVHPDKQIGTPHELLAKAIFTELNDAWNSFEENN